jgi:hypothetical protein
LIEMLKTLARWLVTGTPITLVPLLGILSGAAPAAAQQVRAFQMTGFEGFLETGVRTEREERTRAGGGTSFDRELTEIYEAIRMDLDGYVYHPRFLKFDGGFRVDFVQELQDTLLERDNRVLHLNELRLKFLPEHFFGLTLWGRNSTGDLGRRFAPDVEIDSKEYGARFHYRRGWLPFQLSYRHWDRSAPDTREIDVDTKGDEVFFRGDYSARDRMSEGTVEFEWVDETVQRVANERFEFSIDNTTFFSADRRKRLWGSLRYREQSALNDVTNYSAQTSFDWDHTDTLFSRYYVDFDRTEFDRGESTFVSPRFLLRHRLFLSLTTEVELYGDFEDASFADTQRYGGSLLLSYTKKLGSWGVLGLTVFPHAQETHRDQKQATAFVNDERRVLNTTSFVTLREQDINTASIIVTDQENSFVFEEGLDYEVITRGTRTEIRSLLPPGRIADGEAVLIDYSYAVPGDSTIRTTGVDYSASLSLFQHALLYGRVQQDDQSQRSGVIDQRLDSRDRKIVGASLTWPWFTARVEFEDDSSTYGPFRSLTEYIAVSTRSTGSWGARLSAEHRSASYRDTDEDLQQISVNGTFMTRVGKRARFQIGANYLRQQWDSGVVRRLGDRDQISAQAAFTWYYKQIEVRLESDLQWLDQEGQRDLDYDVFLRLRRYF